MGRRLFARCVRDGLSVASNLSESRKDRRVTVLSEPGFSLVAETSAFTRQCVRAGSDDRQELRTRAAPLEDEGDSPGSLTGANVRGSADSRCRAEDGGGPEACLPRALARSLFGPGKLLSREGRGGDGLPLSPPAPLLCRTAPASYLVTQVTHVPHEAKAHIPGDPGCRPPGEGCLGSPQKDVAPRPPGPTLDSCCSAE